MVGCTCATESWTDCCCCGCCKNGPRGLSSACGLEAGGNDGGKPGGGSLCCWVGPVASVHFLGNRRLTIAWPDSTLGMITLSVHSGNGGSATLLKSLSLTLEEKKIRDLSKMVNQICIHNRASYCASMHSTVSLFSCIHNERRCM